MFGHVHRRRKLPVAMFQSAGSRAADVWTSTFLIRVLTQRSHLACETTQNLKVGISSSGDRSKPALKLANRSSSRVAQASLQILLLTLVFVLRIETQHGCIACIKILEISNSCKCPVMLWALLAVAGRKGMSAGFELNDHFARRVVIAVEAQSREDESAF